MGERDERQFGAPACSPRIAERTALRSADLIRIVAREYAVREFVEYGHLHQLRSSRRIQDARLADRTTHPRAHVEDVRCLQSAHPEAVLDKSCERNAVALGEVIETRGNLAKVTANWIRDAVLFRPSVFLFARERREKDAREANADQ